MVGTNVVVRHFSEGDFATTPRKSFRKLFGSYPQSHLNEVI